MSAVRYARMITNIIQNEEPLWMAAIARFCHIATLFFFGVVESVRLMAKGALIDKCQNNSVCRSGQ